ncbi:MAG TPA: polyphenol oxidase family protein [Planctomycetota bacterium]|nr:polyphenol oxidase family protein [Planctomycetota bacterium]
MKPHRAPDGTAWFESELLPSVGVRAAFSTRAGGVSLPPFDGLNLGAHVGDEPAAVGENRRRWFSALGLDPSVPVGIRQVHGAAVVRAGPEARGHGARDWDSALADADGVLTVERSLPLFCLSADCALAALAAPGGAGCAVLHAGWRGLAAGIIERGARELAAAAGCRTEDLRAFVGPMLGADSYEVREDFAAALEAAWGPAEAGRFLRRRPSGGTHFLFDSAVARRFEIAGIAPRNVESAGLCTASRADLFFSHRTSGGRCGRMAMAVWIT